MMLDESAKELLEVEVNSDKPRRKQDVNSQKALIARELTAIYQTLMAGNEEVLATNNSSWSWEDDADDVTAELLMDTVGSLSLKVTKTHTKYGLGAGVRSEVVFDDGVGTMERPNIMKIRSVLKRWGHERTRSGTPFKRLWKCKANGQDMELSIIIEDKLIMIQQTADARGEEAPALKFKQLRERIHKMVDGVRDDELEHLAEVVYNN